MIGRIRHLIKVMIVGVARMLLVLTFKISFSNRQKKQVNILPKRILIFNGAHIGDLVITTSIIPVLQSAYPNAKIGFVVGTWSSMVIEDHPAVTWIHRVDHWWCNRSKSRFFGKFNRYIKTRRNAFQEICSVHYDMAICVYPYLLPDFMDLAFQCGIPVRLGFRRGLFAPLATMLTEVPQNDFMHQGAIQAEVLSPLHLNKIHLQKRKAFLPDSTQDSVKELCALLKISQLSKKKYRVIHMGSGSASRELSPLFWHKVAETLSKSCFLVFTGRGSREASNIALAMNGLSNCINACNKLSWKGFVAAIRYADIVYGVESMAGHVAAAVGTQSVVAYTEVAGVARWRPESECCTVFSKHMSCAICGYGCKKMTCLKEVAADDLVKVNKA
jgi:ADP-heptose:LPS heptosyltransferase